MCNTIFLKFKAMPLKIDNINVFEQFYLLITTSNFTYEI
ncbi:hypothetical protein PESP_b0605 [Pseudoalteromonas espejiana DSM 9414]|nr:hypothetical protein PESP_b0605 [Pseudoalteromonas espejiana DSM 9414]